jgi:hypothetical protein
MKEFILDVLEYRERKAEPQFRVLWNTGEIEWLSESKVYEAPMYHEPGKKPVGPMTQLLKNSYEEPPDEIIPLMRRFLSLPEEFFKIVFADIKRRVLLSLLNEGTLNLSGNDAITELQDYIREYNKYKKREGEN